jgi:hypothetical protein
MRLAIEVERLADDARSLAEAPLPERVREEDLVVTPWHLGLRAKRAPQERLNPEQGQQPRRGAPHAHLLGVSLPGERGVLEGQPLEAREGA